MSLLSRLLPVKSIDWKPAIKVSERIESLFSKDELLQLSLMPTIRMLVPTKQGVVFLMKATFLNNGTNLSLWYIDEAGVDRTHQVTPPATDDTLLNLVFEALESQEEVSV